MIDMIPHLSLDSHMKKSLIALICFSFTSLALADEALAPKIPTTEAIINSHRIQGCESWRYSNGDYVCGFPGMAQTLPDYYDTVRSFQALEDKISQLEERIKKLEGH